jgi:hypothetical protein
MKTPEGKTIDPTHIYMVGIETNASQALYLNSVFLSDDGENDITAITAPEAQAVNTESSHSNYFDLTGRPVTRPTKGLYIVGRRKVYVK